MKTVSNILRYNSDFLFAAFCSWSAQSSLMMGLPLICFYSRAMQQSRKAYRNAGPVNGQLLLQDYLQSENLPSFLTNPTWKLWTLLNMKGLLFNLLDADRIRQALTGDGYLDEYHRRRKAICDEVFGKYNIVDPARKTAEIIMHYVDHGTFGKDCAAILLRKA